MSCRPSRLLVGTCFAILTAAALGQDNGAQSLGDYARKVRKESSDEVRMTDADTKKLFASVDRIYSFSAEDSGLTKHVAVKRRLVSKADVEKYMTGQLAKEEYTQRFAREEVSMKKLGFLPREFNLKEFLVKSTGSGVAGYYDPETKIISLLNWVPADHQEPILAHELTHALQDQNYDLQKWMKAATKKLPNSKIDSEDDDSAIARKAVVEGQAMVVYVDYLLAPFHRNLTDTPGLIYQMEDPAVKAVQDSQLLHDAPMILRESGTFAYKEGLIFEGELLHKGGKQMAFSGAFIHPPRNSHQVLQPESYINGEKLTPLVVPDLKQLTGDQYEEYDEGGVGQLDVRAYMKQYGNPRNAEEVSTWWLGGSYTAFQKKTSSSTEASPTTSDLALLYVSRWKTPQAAERFASFYVSSIPNRYRIATPQLAAPCTGPKCPVSSAQFMTEEGSVIVEQWPDNRVMVSESFDTALAAKIFDTIRNGSANVHTGKSSQFEIGMRLFEIPAFRRFAEEIGTEIAVQMQGAQP